MKITNHSNISLPLAVWLLADDYDYISDPKYISVTSLMKPLKQFILAKRVPANQKQLDVADLVSSALGRAVHDSVETAWKKHKDKALKQLGYSDSVIERVVVNPSPEYLDENPDAIPVYFEQRKFKKFRGWTIGGKYDMVADGQVQDLKSTSVYTFLKGRKDEDYIKQLSAYKWLADEITAPTGTINFVFTDWQRGQALQNADYPQTRLETKEFALQTDQEVEGWIGQRLSELERLINASEMELPPCDDRDLWRDPPQYKYYSDPLKINGRSTKNFDNSAEAYKHLSEKGKGVIIEKKGKAKACEYCSAAPVCKQYEAMNQ